MLTEYKVYIKMLRVKSLQTEMKVAEIRSVSWVNTPIQHRQA